MGPVREEAGSGRVPSAWPLPDSSHAGKGVWLDQEQPARIERAMSAAQDFAGIVQLEDVKFAIDLQDELKARPIGSAAEVILDLRAVEVFAARALDGVSDRGRSIVDADAFVPEPGQAARI